MSPTRSLAVLAVAVSALGSLTLAVPNAEASEPSGYDALCLNAQLPNGKPLPKVCVPNPLP